MEEDVGVKVTVTRLRRRLSVEQSDDGGSPAPSTPTKKRGGRLAAKPQLELIEENALVSSPRKTRRKSLATDAEEKPVTPSRRSARIKSNSSIVSDTLSVQATDSPRAKRAARRTSQAGSDNEGPATPIRQTRRTRKDSTSSVEQVCLPSPQCWPDIIGVAGPQEVTLHLPEETSSHKEPSALVKPLPVVEMVIEEEPENEVQKAVNKSKSSPSAADAEELSPNSARKSKRLLEKRNRRSGSYKSEQDSSNIENKSLNISASKKAGTESQNSPSNKSAKSKESSESLSESNVSFSNKIETEPKINLSNHNKSASALDSIGNDKSKRTRTESWPAVTISVESDSINFSDNERSKKKKGNLDNNTSALNGTDHNVKMDKSNTSINDKNTSQSFLDTSSKRKKKKSESNVEDNSKPSEDINTLQVLPPKEDKISIASDKSENSDVDRDMAKLFENAPENVQAIVYFDDSDSNSIGAANLKKVEHVDSEDQCVPVVKHDFQENLSPKELGGNDNIVLLSQENEPCTNISLSKIANDDVNNSCEPMDIDETIHEEILQKSIDSLKQSNKSLKLSQHSSIEDNNNSKRKSTISNSGVNTPDISKDNKRKTSLSNSGTTTPELSKNSNRKTSISNSVVNTPDLSKDNKRATSISNSGTNTPDLSINGNKKSLNTDSVADTSSHQSKNNKRKSSISSSGTDTPDKSKNDKRKSSISNIAADTPNLSKNSTNNKSTLILSQLKDVSSTSENLKSPKLPINEVLSESDINEKSNINKKIPKGNLSLNDVKGTPKQNSVQKLTMQTSTPITTHQLAIKSKIEEQKQEGTKKNKSNFSKSINDTDSSEEERDDDDQPSVEKNELLDDEAEEASDDYESGDSQDEEDRRYEEENEIKVRGETLTSDDDMSNDTDYEKDSFVVSSDAEDKDLLSGSGDDLSMSDNELTMSKKSKKKFNERKLKEQKNASREMFESRHKLNSSDDKSKAPKTKKNRMRIDSSLLASDEEVVVNPKKSNHIRLDSTLNESSKVEESNQSLNKSNKNKSKQGSVLDTSDRQVETNVSQKKDKSMRNSICGKFATDEKEITIFNESTDNADPLQVLVKQEPKTPQKDLNMSVVQFTDREEIENVQVTEGNSIMNQTGADPLQATVDYEDSDSSESEEILQNYDSVLNELNKDNKTKFNKNNVSLNRGKNTKRNQVEPIIDQLNLTHTKKSKKNKDIMGDTSQLKTIKAAKEKLDCDNEDSSDSIDLQLLFSEDNCGSDDEQKPQQNKTDDDNMFIPLKISPGKTNIRENIDTVNVSKNVSTNESGMKKKKKHSISEPVEESKDTLNVSKNINISMNESGMKKKKKPSLSEPTDESTQDLLNASKNVNVSLNESGMKKKTKHSISEPATEESQDLLNVSKNVNVSMNESGMKKKKKHSISEPASEETQDLLNVSKNVIVSMNESGMKKKKKHSISEPAAEEAQGSFNVSKNVNVSMNESGMKKKKKHSISEPAAEEIQDSFNVSKNVNVSMNESGMKKKKKHSISEPAAEEMQDSFNVSKNVNVSMNESGMKKKKKHSISEPAEEETQGILDASKNLNISTNESGMKKKKKHSISEPIEETRGVPDVVEPELNESKKRKKKRKTSLSVEPESNIGELFFIDTTGTLQDNKDECDELEEPPLKVVYESKKRKKRNKLKKYGNETEQNDNTVEESTAPMTPKKEKKKKKQILETLARDDDSDGAPEEAPYQSEKASEMDLQNIETVTESADSAKKKHKKKKKKKSASASNQSGESVDTENIIPSNSKKRKRKSSNTENSQVSGDADAHESVEIGKHNELVGSNKKRKISHNEDNTSGSIESKKAKKNKTKHRDVNFLDIASTSGTTEIQVKKNKKRKHRDDDGDSKQMKVKKDNSFQEVHVPRLPDTIIRQLDDKPRKIESSKVISTSSFIVENARQKRAKPSNYLEESIYLDEKSPLTKKQKQRIKKPKVLPFIPTASISDSGYTTNFKINKLSLTTTFEAESVGFSKETYLQKNNIKRLGTYDRYKKQMHHKMSKF